IISDRGTPFVNDAVETWLQDAGIEKATTTAYNPMANGEAESEVKNLKRELEKLLDDQKDFDEKLGTALMFLRYKIRSDSGKSAYEQRRGQPMKLLKHLK